ncbi:MAG: beta-ketoacyl-ACP synthase II [Bacteriovoracaceae bacterium]|nr:beta-ketoacyl-ACP synthase II [Bacteriovoracaceae bacterium]
MTHQRRVAITGLEAICGLGFRLEDIWKGMLEGRSGISPISNISSEGLTTTIAGEIKNFNLSEEIWESKQSARFDRFIHYAMHSAHHAYAVAGLKNQNFYPAQRIGCILGVGMGGFHTIEATHIEFQEKGLRRISPFFIPGIIPNMATGIISLQLGIKGMNYTVSSACASSAHAISIAAGEIMSGRQDVVITGGAEGVITRLTMGGFCAMKALSRRNDEPTKASRPFDIERDGFVMGEGAGILVLEDMEKAIARGATIYGEVVGWGATSDAYHITAPHPEGGGTIPCMQQALHSAGISPEQVGYINAHGTSTPLGDIAETKAIKSVFGNHANNLLVSSTKSMTGHLLGAAGGIESVFCVMAMHTGIVPPTINLDHQDPECDLNYVPHKPVKANIEYSLNNSFGFGGTNASLIFKKYF